MTERKEYTKITNCLDKIEKKGGGRFLQQAKERNIENREFPIYGWANEELSKEEDKYWQFYVWFTKNFYVNMMVERYNREWLVSTITPRYMDNDPISSRRVTRSRYPNDPDFIEEWWLDKKHKIFYYRNTDGKEFGSKT